MLEKSLGVLFFLKQPKNPKQVGRYVYLRITVNGIAKEISTKRIWFADRWNQATGRAIGNKEEAKNLNSYLDSLHLLIHQAKQQLIEAGREISSQQLKDIVTGKTEETGYLLKVFRQHKDKIFALVDNGYSIRTYRRYNTTYDHVVEFIKWKYNQDDLKLTDLNYEFASDLSFWLKTERKCAHNSTMKYISTLKSVLIECRKKKWLKEDPFAEFKTTQNEVEIVPLYVEELEVLRKKEITIPRLALVRDIFLFSCFTGLAYVDVSNLRRNQIIKGIDGEQWIITKRQKTDTPQRVPLLKPALEIMNLYHGHPRCANSNYVLPILTNQKMNAYLKEIADLCGITQKLTFHIARHTFATTVTLGNGVPIETVSKMLGHTNLKQTMHYAKIIDLKTSQDMTKIKRIYG